MATYRTAYGAEDVEIAGDFDDYSARVSGVKGGSWVVDFENLQKWP